VMVRRAAVVVMLASLSAGLLSAQTVRLQSRVDPQTYAALRMIIDSAKKAKLPTKLIEDNALEGASSGASGSSIVSAVRQFTKQLTIASATLGPAASADELRAAVSAIDARIPVGDLKRIRRAASKRSITTALTVLSDIAERGVPLPTSSDLLVSLLSHKVKDTDLLTFARWVNQDIEKGGNPSKSASARANALITASKGAD
jgi:hypothetical protein